jgi:hypothetical protein
MTIKRNSLAAIVFLLLGAANISFSQEGFPLDGTWRGQWQSSDGGIPVVIVMKWDGDRIGGTINPGPNSTPFSNARLQADTWTVLIEADPENGAPISIVGTLREIGSYNRFIEGTWTQGGSDHAFRITRE